MNSKLLAALAVLALGAGPLAAQAGGRHDDDRGRDGYHHYDRHDNRARARVVRVEPLYERVRYMVPVEHCWNEQVRRVRGDSASGAAVAGGLIGAVIGNRVGDGRGVATVAGAIAGAAIGNELGRDGRHREVVVDHVRRCEVRQEARFEQRVVAYRVTYEFRGRRDVTRLAYDPGRYVAIADIRRRG